MTHYSNTSNPVDFPKLSTVDRLWGQALDRAVPDTYSSLTWTQVERIKSVFAELLIQECVDVALYGDEHEQARTNVQQHFGVEQ